MSIVAIIQARMGSSRLPNKMLLNMHGYPIVEWVYRRVKQSRLIDQVIFALPDTSQDNILAWFLESLGASVFRGSETDLVDRYYQTAKNASADEIIRICADNPLICASEIDRLIDFFKLELCDYAYNHSPRGNYYPDGIGAEICSIELLEEIKKKATTSEQREHLFNSVWDNKSDYTIKTFDPIKEIAHPELKFDVDTMDDYQRLLEKPYRIDMSAVEIIQIALKY